MAVPGMPMQTGLVEKRESVPAEGRHQPAVIGHVDEVDGDEPGRAGQLAVRADAPDVMRVRERHDRDPGLPGARHRGGHRLARHPPAEPALAVEHEERAVVLHHLRGGVGHDQPFLQVPHVVRDQAHPVAVVAGEVGVDEVAGHEVGLRGLAAAAGDDGGGQPAKTVGGYAHRGLLAGGGHQRSLPAGGA